MEKQNVEFVSDSQEIVEELVVGSFRFSLNEDGRPMQTEVINDEHKLIWGDDERIISANAFYQLIIACKMYNEDRKELLKQLQLYEDTIEKQYDTINELKCDSSDLRDELDKVVEEYEEKLSRKKG